MSACSYFETHLTELGPRTVQIIRSASCLKGILNKHDPAFGVWPSVRRSSVIVAMNSCREPPPEPVASFRKMDESIIRPSTSRGISSMKRKAVMRNNFRAAFQGKARLPAVCGGRSARFHKSSVAIRQLLLDGGQEMHVVMCISKSLPVRELARGRCRFRHDCLCSSSCKGIIDFGLYARV